MTQRRHLIPLAAACAAIVLLSGLLIAFPSQGASVELEESFGHSHHHARFSHRNNQALHEEEKAATTAQKEMLKDGPMVDRTEDRYIAARSRLSSLRAKLRDNAHLARHLGVLQKSRDEEVRDATAARKEAAMQVAAEQTTLSEAQKWAAQARAASRAAEKARGESGAAEAQGIALQKPAAALLADSQKLNDQSNLVLDQSHSAQAKALAALDLKLAQSLADRASSGMARAKKYFATAIAERKAAVKESGEAAKETMQAAQESLKQNAEAPELLSVLHGQLSGSDALQAVMTTDTTALAKREAALGEAREEQKEAKGRVGSVAEQISALSRAAAALKLELKQSEKAVVEAAKAHVEASDKYKTATATSLAAQTQVEGLRASEVKELRGRLRDAGASRDKASGAYKKALEKVAELNGRQTVLQVHVARLQLQLKEAEMKRDDEKRKAEQEQQTINNMQAEVDREDGDLNEARLRLADSAIAGGPLPLPADQHSPYPSGPAPLARRGRASGGVQLHAAAAQAEAAAAAAGSPSNVDLALDRQRRADEELREEEEAARRRSRAEEAKLRAAQADVAAELSKVTNIEGGMH